MQNEAATISAKLATPAMYTGSAVAALNGLDANTIQTLSLLANIIGVVGGLIIAYAGYRINRKAKAEEKVRRQEIHELEVAKRRKQLGL